LGVGILACLMVITVNVSYGLGQESVGESTVYSAEYMETYAFYIWEYTFYHGNESTPEAAEEYGRMWADFTLVTDEERQQNTINSYNWVMENQNQQ